MEVNRMLAGATEFCFMWRRISEKPVTITRRTNHGTVLPDGGWAAVIHVGGLNPWYLGQDGHWRYKAYSTWPNAASLIEFIETGRAHTLAESYAVAA